MNIMGQGPLDGSATDARMLKCIRWTNLDAFRSWEPGTVNRVLQKVKRGLAITSSLGFAHALFQPRDPFPLDDSIGVGVVIVMLQRSLAPRRHDWHVQYETVRKFRAAALNIYHSSVKGQGPMVTAKETRKLQVTSCPTYSDFFKWIDKRMHKRMGDVVCLGWALSHDILMELMGLLEDEWAHAHVSRQLNIALEGTFYVLARQRSSPYRTARNNISLGLRFGPLKTSQHCYLVGKI